MRRDGVKCELSGARKIGVLVGRKWDHLCFSRWSFQLPGAVWYELYRGLSNMRSLVQDAVI
jgi:hypothetical protein